MLPAWVPPHLLLCRPERRRWRNTLVEHAVVELPHQLGRRVIIDFPEARNRTLRTSIHECPRQTYEAFASDIFAERRAARAQNHEPCGEF